MTAIFGRVYANLYDAIYSEKDYDRECDVIERAFAAHGGAVRSVIDLGCGTGGHALRLAARGYAVTGVDRSPEMLAIARSKADVTATDVCFVAGDLRHVDTCGPYDAAIMMFAVLGYQHTNDDVAAALSNARRMLRPGGLFLFDAWYGPGVLAYPPAPRARIIDTPAGAVERAARAELDVRRHLCTVRYALTPVASAAPTAHETHVVRFFFPMEIEMYLEASGFRLLRMSDAALPDREPGADCWNVFVEAQAV